MISHPLNNAVSQAEFFEVAQEALATFPHMLPVRPDEFRGADIVKRHQLGETVFTPGMTRLLNHFGGYLDERPDSPLSPLLTSVTQARGRIESGASRESVARIVADSIMSFSQSVNDRIAVIPPADLIIVTAAAYALGQMHSYYGATEATTTRLFKSLAKATLGIESHREDLAPTFLFLNDRMVTGLAFYMLHRIDYFQWDTHEREAVGQSFVRLGLLSGSLEWPTTFCLPNYATSRKQIYGDLDLTVLNHRDLEHPINYIKCSVLWRPVEAAYADLALAAILEGGVSVFDTALDYVHEGLGEMPRSFRLRQLQSVLERYRAVDVSPDGILKELVQAASLLSIATDDHAIDVVSYLLVALG